MPLQGGGKILIRTMQDDLQGLEPKKAVLETKITKKAPPPPKLPTPPPQPQQKPKIKVVEKPVIKEVIKRVEVPKIVEKIKVVEKPIIKEKIIEKKVFVNKSKKLKQIIIILILVVILSIIGLGAYYLLTLPGQEIIIEPEPEPIPEPEPVPEIPTGILPNIPQIMQTKTDQPLNLPESLIFDDYNILIFPDKTMGLVLQIDNALATLAEMVFWEKTITQDINWLFLENKPAQARFKVNNWEYPNIVIRYQDTSDLSNSLHYTLINNKLIITTSEQNIRLIINAILHES